MKTIEEKLQFYLDFIDEKHRPAFRIGFNHCLQFVEKWTKVSECLPKKEGHYLVEVESSFPKNCKIVIAEFYEDNNTFYSESSDSPITDAISWKPISFL